MYHFSLLLLYLSNNQDNKDRPSLTAVLVLHSGELEARFGLLKVATTKDGRTRKTLGSVRPSSYRSVQLPSRCEYCFPGYAVEHCVAPLTPIAMSTAGEVLFFFFFFSCWCLYMLACAEYAKLGHRVSFPELGCRYACVVMFDIKHGQDKHVRNLCGLALPS